MAEDPDHQVQERRRRPWSRQLLEALSAPGSFGLPVEDQPTGS
jgi:hypothetical protein